MKTALKISLILSALDYAFNNILSFFRVFQVFPQNIELILSPINLTYFNMAFGALIGLWLTVAYFRQTSKFSAVLLVFSLLCFFEPLLGTIAAAIYLRLNGELIDDGKKDLLTSLI